MAQEIKAEFRNRTTGYVGVNVINEEGKKNGIALAAGESIWPSEREQVMTANAPRNPANNPFVGGHPDGGPALELVTEPRPIGAQAGERPIGAKLPEPDQVDTKRPRRRSRRQSEETGAAAAAEGEAPEGGYVTGEEVGDPDAPKAA